MSYVYADSGVLRKLNDKSLRLFPKSDNDIEQFYINIRAYMASKNLNLKDDLDYKLNGLYFVNKIAKPNYNQYKQVIHEQLAYDHQSDRVNLRWQVSDLTNDQIKSNYNRWNMPGHWVKWMMHRYGWDIWINEMTELLRVRHADLIVTNNLDRLYLYPDFSSLFHREKVSLSDIIELFRDALPLSVPLKKIISYEQTPDVEKIERAWDLTYDIYQERVIGG